MSTSKHIYKRYRGRIRSFKYSNKSIQGIFHLFSFLILRNHMARVIILFNFWKQKVFLFSQAAFLSTSASLTCIQVLFKPKLILKCKRAALIVAFFFFSCFDLLPRYLLFHKVKIPQSLDLNSSQNFRHTMLFI